MTDILHLCTFPMPSSQPVRALIFHLRFSQGALHLCSSVQVWFGHLLAVWKRLHPHKLNETSQVVRVPWSVSIPSNEALCTLLLVSLPYESCLKLLCFPSSSQHHCNTSVRGTAAIIKAKHASCAASPNFFHSQKQSCTQTLQNCSTLGIVSQTALALLPKQ